MRTEVFQSGEIESLVDLAKAAADGYLNDAVRSDKLNVGVYVLAAGSTDDQTPHEEDEVYYAVRGRARFECDGETAGNVALVHTVQPAYSNPGSLLFVRAGIDHRFRDIEEELVLVVFWAPPHDE